MANSVLDRRSTRLCRLTILLCCYCAPDSIIPNEVNAEEPEELKDSEQPIVFFAPTDGRYLPFYDSSSESSFSVPRPIVMIDPVVLGSTVTYPNNSTVEQIGPDRVKVRITGQVYDFIADMVADQHADIEEVKVSSHSYGTMAMLPVEKITDSLSHPYVDRAPDGFYNALRPYPFAGRFDLGEFELQIHTGYNGINIEATNVNLGKGTATLSIRTTVNRDEGQYDIEVDERNSMDIELYNPILVYINDPEVTVDNIDSAYALLNGKRVGLRFVDEQLQLDRPIIGLSRATPPDTVPNIVNVTGDPDRFHVRYKNHEATFTWSYTR